MPTQRAAKAREVRPATAAAAASGEGEQAEQAVAPSQAAAPPFDEQARAYFQEHPNQFGWIAIAIGGVIVLGAWRKWDWIFEGGGGRFNIAAFADTFGLRAAQLVMALLGLALVGAGVGFLYWY